MATITASLERSLQNCSLNNNLSGVIPADGFSDSSENHVLNNNPSDDATLDLNSEISLPYHWEQCLDLKVPTIYIPPTQQILLCFYFCISQSFVFLSFS